jgi:hypothetical protein
LTEAQQRRRRERLARRRSEQSARELRATSEASAAWRWFIHGFKQFAGELVERKRKSTYAERRRLARHQLREIRTMQRQAARKVA